MILDSSDGSVSFVLAAEGGDNRVYFKGNKDLSQISMAVCTGGKETSKIDMTANGIDLLTEGTLNIKANAGVNITTQGQFVRKASKIDGYFATEGDAYVPSSCSQIWDDPEEERFE